MDCKYIVVLYFDWGGAELELFYDANDYWDRGTSLWQNGYFSFLNLEDGFRGYFYPLYLGICSRCGALGFISINSILISCWFVYTTPKLHNIKDINYKSLRWNVRCISCFLLFYLFFYGLIRYPLSDLFAIVICSLAIVLELKLEIVNGFKEVILSFLLGSAMYLAYNVRTIYLFAGIWLFGKLILYLIKCSRTIANKFCILIASLIGIVIAAIPQIYINYSMLGKISLTVPTDGLMLRQVVWGIIYQRYDTFVGIDAAHPSPRVCFMDPVGSALLESLGIDGFENWGEFFKFVYGHPFELVGIYTRHIINGMLPCWPNQFVMDLNNNKMGYAVISVFMFFLFGVALMNKMIQIEVFKRYTPLLIPILFILCGAVEVRFFAAGYLLVIGTLCFNVDWTNMKAYLIANKYKELALFIIFGCVLVTLWSSMLASESVTSLFLFKII